MNATPDNTNTTFNDGYIENGPYEGLYVLALATCMVDSAWDYPAFIWSIDLGHLYDDEPDGEPPMHPTIEDACLIADAIDLAADERDAFIANFPLSWST